MKQRILTGVVMFVVIVGVLFLAIYVYPPAFDIFALLLMLVAGYEISKAIANKYSKPLNLIIFLYIILGYVAFKIVHRIFGQSGITSFFAVLALLIVAAIVYNIFNNRQSLSNVISTVFCMVYPLSIMVYFLALNYLGVGKVLPEGLAFSGWEYKADASGVFTPNYRAIAIIMVLVCSSCTDMFALFVGMTFKGPKLAPLVSPKKTISGGIGGIFGSMFGGAVVMMLGYIPFGFMGLSPLSESIGVNIALYMGLAVGIGFATELGDLIASYIKRYCDVKDYGNIFPGHGGMLDRIDGVIMSAVYAFAYITVILMVGRLTG